MADTATKTKAKRSKKGKGTILTEARAQAHKELEAKTKADLASDVVMGRPSSYSKAKALKICAGIAAGNSLRSVLRNDPKLPSLNTVFNWLGDGKHDEFLAQYARACEERTEAFAEDILDISDDGTNDWMRINRAGQESWVVNGEAIGRSKLRVETRLSLMAKLKPLKYGTKVDITSNGEGLPAPLIYIPRELPYTAVKQQERGIIDATSTDEPAATSEGPQA